MILQIKDVTNVTMNVNVNESLTDAELVALSTSLLDVAEVLNNNNNSCSSQIAEVTFLMIRSFYIHSIIIQLCKQLNFLKHFF